MPLQHIVWLKKKDHCSDREIQNLLKELLALVDVIPEIESISCGENITDRANGFTHGIIVTLTGPEALQGYLSHPAHKVVGGKLAQNADLMAMDYES